MAPARAVVASALVAVVVLFSVARCARPKGPLDYPHMVGVAPGVCTDDEWVLGASIHSGGPAWPGTRSAAMVRVDPDLSIETDVVGKGLLDSLSRSDDLMWAVQTHESGSAVLKSVDGGRSWEPREVAPAQFTSTDRLRGVVPVDRDRCYAYSMDAVYYTHDGGNSWRGAHLATQGPGQQVALTADGNLWLFAASVPSGERIVVISPQLKILREVALPELDDLSAIQADRDNGVLVLGITREWRSAVLFRVSSLGQVSPPLWERSGQMGTYLKVSGSRIVVVRVAQHDTWFGGSAVEVSDDSGVTWRSKRIASRIDANNCASDKWLWTVGARGRLNRIRLLG